MCVTERGDQRRSEFQRRVRFDSIWEPVARFVASSHVPVTSLLLYSENEIYRKTFLGTASPTPSSFAPKSSHSHLRSEERNDLEGIPEALKSVTREELDAVGGKTMFAIGSLVKPLVALLCCMLIEKDIYRDLKWDTRVYTLLRKLYEKPMLFREVSKSDEPTVKSLLLHSEKALPDLDHFILLADGTFQLNDGEFVQNLETVMDDLEISRTKPEKTQNGYLYSNANTILITLLLVKMAGCNINKVMCQHLFDPLDMHRTTLDGQTFNQMETTNPTNVARGCRISSSLEVLSLAPKHNYLDSNISAVTVGGWSCTDDLAKLYGAICEAGDQKTTDHSGKNPITRNMADMFLQQQFRIVEDGLPPAPIAFAGLVYDYRDPTEGMESLNYAVRQLKNPKQHKFRAKGQYLKSGNESHLYYKGGTADGFTASIYFDAKSRAFAIALSNAAGPIDITEPSARYLVEAAMQIEIGIDTEELVKNFMSRFQDQVPLACELWRELESEDADIVDWTENLEPYVGTYKHASHGLELEITLDGQANFRRSPRLLTTMKIRALNGTLRLFSATEGLFIDRLTTFRDTTLRIEDEGKVILRSNKDKDKYIKQ